MEASIRDIVNTNQFPFFLPMSNPIEINNIFENINIDALRGRSFVLSPNSLRDSSIHSDALSQIYTNKIEVENVKLDQAKQVEFQNFYLSCQSNQQEMLHNKDQDTNIGNKARKKCAVNEALALNSTLSSQVEHEAIVYSENSSQSNHYEILLAYDINKPMEPKAWDSEAHSYSFFGIIEFLEIDAKNIYTSLLYMTNFIRSGKVQAGSVNNILQLKGFGEATQNFISSIYEAKQDSIDINDKSSFRTKVSRKFTPKIPKTKSLSTSNSSKDKTVKIFKYSPSISACLFKKVLEKSKFFGKGKKKVTMNKVPQNKSYVQVAGPSVSEILKSKKNYSNFLAKKIENIQKIINDSDKSKPYIKMTIKDSSCKQIIIPINKENTNKFMISASNYIANINSDLKSIKSNVMADYI